MKSMKSMMMSGAIMLGLAMCLTSCEGTLDDIFGEWTKPTPTPIPAKSLTITDQLLRVEKGTLQAIAFTADPVDAAITWKSDNEAVATVDAEGKITPIKAGEVTITATSGVLNATVTIKVYDKIVDIQTSSGDVVVGENEVCLINGDKDTPENKSILIGKGAKVTLNGINITKQIVCDGDATITLADGSENKVTGTDNKAGIRIGEASTTTLTINAETEGTGVLNATGGSNGGAGIGTNIDSTGGDIVINGGKITATGGVGAAGIGTGKAADYNNSCGAITINGGEITATGQNGGAGIGTGKASDASNTCGAITITGGMVNATGGSCGAGIGAGYSYQYFGTAIQTCGDISITADVTSVTATKGSGSPNSIGKGLAGDGTQNCGTITIDPSANVTEN